MGEAVKKLARRTALAVLVVLAAYAGWKGGDVIFPHIETALGVSVPEEGEASPLVTPQAADLAEERIAAFRASDDPELRLKPFEISSLLRYSVPGMIPRGVHDPSVVMEGDRIEIQASVVPSVMPSLPDLGVIVGILPDTVAVSVGGSLVPFGEAGSILLVKDMSIHGISLPAGTFPDILAALGRTGVKGLPPAAILVPAFTEIRGAYIENGELVLVRA